jgi:hypothetical protein
MSSSLPPRHRTKSSPPESGILTAFDHAVSVRAKFRASDFTLRTKDDVLDVAEVFSRIVAMSGPNLPVRSLETLPLLNQLPAEPAREKRVIAHVIKLAVPWLLRLEARLREYADDANGDAWLECLRKLVLTSTPAAGEPVVLAIESARHPENWRWAFLFRDLRESTYILEQVLKTYADRLPPAPFLDRYLVLGKSGCLSAVFTRHPMDLPAARSHFEKWLRDPSVDNEICCHAIVSLAYMKQPWAAGLLAEAVRHPYPRARLEAAWALAKQGDAGGITVLKSHCVTPGIARRAAAYLKELGLADHIPSEAADPVVQAKDAVHEWLDHRDGWRLPPDTIEVVHREATPVLFLEEPLDTFVLLARAVDPYGVRIEFSAAAVVFAENADFADGDGQFYPSGDYENSWDDWRALVAYAVCRLAEDEEVVKSEYPEQEPAPPAAMDGLRSAGRVPVGPCYRWLAQFDDDDQVMVLFAIWEMGGAGDKGWLLARWDGDTGEVTQERLYASQFAAGTETEKVLQMFVGARMCGWRLEPDTVCRQLPSPPLVTPSPTDALAAYESLIVRAERASGDEREALTDRYAGPLADRLPAYLDAAAALGSAARGRGSATMAKFRQLVPDPRPDTAARLAPWLAMDSPSRD